MTIKTIITIMLYFMLFYSTNVQFSFIFQDSARSQKKLSVFRRSLNALQYRITKRGRSKPPDWFLDKFSTASDSRLHSSQHIPSDGTSSRLSVDPSLPSYYRVSTYIQMHTFEMTVHAMCNVHNKIDFLFVATLIIH